jgi:hypothetical protein
MLQNGYWRSVAVQAVPEPEICHGAGFILRAGARVRVQVSAGFVLGAGVKAKTMTNNLPILSVLAGEFIYFLVITKVVMVYFFNFIFICWVNS